MNMVRKQESTETPIPIKTVSVQFIQKSSSPFRISKFSANPVITAEDQSLAQAYMGELLKTLPEKAEKSLVQALANKGVSNGSEYLIVITMDQVQLKMQKESTLGFATGDMKASIETLGYQASLYRNEDKKVLWRAIMDVTHLGKTLVDIPTTGGEIAAKVTNELQSAGWIK